jgi:hypothetical protein
MASSISIPPRPETRFSENVWAGATLRFFRHELVAKSGVAPAHSGRLPASKLSVAPSATSVLLTLSTHPWVTRMVTEMVICVSHASVTFPNQKTRLNFIRIFVPLPIQRPQKQKM